MRAQHFGLTVVAFAALSATVVFAGAAAPNPSGTLTRHELAVKGMERSYIQYVPRN